MTCRNCAYGSGILRIRTTGNLSGKEGEIYLGCARLRGSRVLRKGRGISRLLRDQHRACLTAERARRPVQNALITTFVLAAVVHGNSVEHREVVDDTVTAHWPNTRE